MAQILDSLPPDCTDRILCCYINDDRKIKVARIINIPNWCFERVIFPGEKLLFESVSEAYLEIYTTIFSTVALVEITACDRLALKDSRTDQKRIAQWREQWRKQFAAELDKSFNIAEKFIRKESFSSHLIRESRVVDTAFRKKILARATRKGSNQRSSFTSNQRSSFTDVTLQREVSDPPVDKNGISDQGDRG